jgi:hypothetical protein
MRNRYKHTTTLEERLLKAADDLRAKAKELLAGKDRDTLLEKARQFENQVSTNELFVPPQGVDGKSLEPQSVFTHTDSPMRMATLTAARARTSLPITSPCERP